MSLNLEWSEGQVVGTINAALTPDAAASLGGAFGTMLGEGALVVTARDNYPPSRMLKRAFSAGLMSVGVSVMDFHAATTPELVFAIKRLGAKAGIQFTVASLDRDSVAIRFFDSQGFALSAERIEELVEWARAGRVVRSLPSAIGWGTYAEYVHDIYAAAVAGYLNVGAIAGRHLRVVCDVNFGPASDVLPNLLSELGIEGILLNAHKPPVRGTVTHMPHPRSVAMLGSVVKATGASLGASLCADATRVLLVDDEGRPLSAEEVACLLIANHPPGTRVVVSESMSSVVDEAGERAGAKVVRVRDTMHDMLRVARRTGAHLVVNGGNEVVFTDFSYSPDGMLTTLKVLEMIASSQRELSSLRDDLPKPQLVHRTVNLPGVDYLAVLRTLHREARDAVITITGLRVRVGGVWVNIEAKPEKLELTCEGVEGAEEALDKLERRISILTRELARAEGPVC